MEDKFLKILKQGRTIEPRAEFKERSRALIFKPGLKQHGIIATLVNEIRENLKFGVALTLASFFIFAVLGGAIPIKNIFKRDSVAFNGDELLREVENLNFQIQLGEARYFNESALEIAAILGQIKNSESEIDKLLNEIIF